MKITNVLNVGNFSLFQTNLNEHVDVAYKGQTMFYFNYFNLHFPDQLKAHVKKIP